MLHASFQNPGLLPYGLCQPKSQVLLGVRNHHDATALLMHEDMVRSLYTGKSPTELLEFTYQVSTAHMCMIHTKLSTSN